VTQDAQRVKPAAAIVPQHSQHLAVVPRLVPREQAERNERDQGGLQKTKEAHALPESLPKSRDLWHYNRAVVAPLSDVLAVLQRLAPLDFAEAWDNVGLLLEPVPLSEAPPLAHALLTIELTTEVVSEAEALGAKLIIAYHPPIFQGLKRLRMSTPGDRALLGCATRGIAIFSPHTALDAAPDGLNDWLLDAFGPGTRSVCFPDVRDARFGQGRGLQLDRPVVLSEAVAQIKRHLGLSRLRVSPAPAHAADASPVRSVAVCAGAGGAVFEKLSGYDLFVTGEMRYHDVRARALSGSSVVLCEHTHTERGFLPLFAERLSLETAKQVTFHVSRCDREVLSVV
jgi:dinuclear metal center YbgI/SA1388 family protein